tara:strand:- start:1137 stop:2039 length:903 start_codon:yes stop_codon:yes gene_type:complete
MASDYEIWAQHAKNYESNPHYLNLMKMDSSGYGPGGSTASLPPRVKILQGRNNLKKLNVMPKGSILKDFHLKRIFNKYGNKTDAAKAKSEFLKKINVSIDFAIYKTPGNDDYVYKNRASRLYNIVINNVIEKLLRNKKKKLKLAIPLKDASTPILLAQAYLDWFTFIINVKGMSDYINNDPSTLEILEMLNVHKEYLKNYYKDNFGLKVFDEEGFTVCTVTGYKFKLEDIADIERDNRVDIRPTDNQMGHNEGRNEKCPTIRGLNLLPMTRRGNLIVGEHKVTDSAWREELTDIINYHNS